MQDVFWSSRTNAGLASVLADNLTLEGFDVQTAVDDGDLASPRRERSRQI
jgi:hypothetical protein